MKKKWWLVVLGVAAVGLAFWSLVILHPAPKSQPQGGESTRHDTPVPHWVGEVRRWLGL